MAIRDRINTSSESPQPLTVLAEARAFVFGPDLFMTDLVSDHRPQFLDTEQEEGPRGNQDDGPPMNADGCLGTIDHRGTPIRVRSHAGADAERRALPSPMIQVLDLPVCRERPHHEGLTLRRNRRRRVVAIHRTKADGSPAMMLRGLEIPGLWARAPGGSTIPSAATTAAARR